MRDQETIVQGRRITPDYVRHSTGIGIAILAVVTVLGAWLLGGSSSETRATDAIDTAKSPAFVSAKGTLNPGLTVSIGSNDSGTIVKILCDFNTTVKRGQLCAQIDPRPYQTVVDQDRAALATAKAQLEKDEANLLYTSRLLKNYNALWAQNAISRDQVNILTNSDAQAQAQIDLDKASIVEHEAALEAAQVYLDYTNIVSPIDGTVVSRNAVIGQTITTSFQTPTLFVVSSDLSRMELDADVSEKDIGSIHAGDKAVYSTGAFPYRSFTGKVTQVRLTPQRIQDAVTYTVVVGVDNSQHIFRPGMTAAVRIYATRRVPFRVKPVPG